MNGNNVKIYQDITLIALNVKKNLYNKKCHPTIEDYIKIYEKEIIIRDETFIDQDSAISINTRVLEKIIKHVKDDNRQLKILFEI